MLYREIIAFCAEIDTEYINTLCGQNVEFLGAFAKLRKVTIRVMSVRLSLLMKLGFHLTDLHYILYLRIFRKSVKELEVCLESHKNSSRYFT
jgi:hypothetical protein